MAEPVCEAPKLGRLEYISAVYGTGLSTHSSTQDMLVILSPKTLWLSRPEGPERNIK